MPKADITKIEKVDSRRTENDVEAYLSAWYIVFSSLSKQPINIGFDNGKVVEVKNTFVGPEYGFAPEQVRFIHERQMAHRNTFRLVFFHDYQLVWLDQQDMGILRKGKEIGVITDYQIVLDTAVMDMRISVASPVVLFKVEFDEEAYSNWLGTLQNQQNQSPSESELSSVEISSTLQ